MIFTLVCWNCEAVAHIESAHPPQFAVELVAMASAAKWIGVIDWNRGRSLVFCSEQCRDSCRKKDGSFRLRRLKMKGGER